MVKWYAISNIQILIPDSHLTAWKNLQYPSLFFYVEACNAKLLIIMNISKFVI